MQNSVNNLTENRWAKEIMHVVEKFGSYTVYLSHWVDDSGYKEDNIDDPALVLLGLAKAGIVRTTLKPFAQFIDGQLHTGCLVCAWPANSQPVAQEGWKLAS